MENDRHDSKLFLSYSIETTNMALKTSFMVSFFSALAVAGLLLWTFNDFKECINLKTVLFLIALFIIIFYMYFVGPYKKWKIDCGYLDPILRGMKSQKCILIKKDIENMTTKFFGYIVNSTDYSRINNIISPLKQENLNIKYKSIHNRCMSYKKFFKEHYSLSVLMDEFGNILHDVQDIFKDVKKAIDKDKSLSFDKKKYLDFKDAYIMAKTKYEIIFGNMPTNIKEVIENKEFSALPEIDC